jgi:sulfate permease, SulP family
MTVPPSATIMRLPRLDRANLLPNLIAGLVIGFLYVIISISLASLIFSGPLNVYLPRGVAIGLTTTMIGLIFVALFSSVEVSIAGLQDNPTVLMSVAVASLATVLGSGPELIASVIALIMLTTLSTGGFFLLIGHYGLGGLMRYIPFPVIGGFLASTGWLMVLGGVNVMLGFPLSLDTLPNLVQPDQIISWLPGIVFGLILFVGVSRIRHFLAMPGLLLGGVAVFYLILVMSGISIEEATQRGLLLNELAGTTTFQPLPIRDLATANGGAVLGQVGNIGAILIISAVSVLLNISGLELGLHKDVDLNHELRTAGIANLLSALLGGMITYQGLSLSILNHQISGKGRMAGVVAGLFCLLMLVIGTSLLTYIPKALLGGLLIFIGLNFLNDWVFQGYKKFGRLDYGVVLLILFIIASTNYLVGVAVGLVLMVIIFVVNYSRTNIFHHIASGAEVSSKVERNAYHQRQLGKMGQQIYALELQGFIFFGSANAIVDHIRKRLSDEQPLAFVVLDFRRVAGIDSSAAFSLMKVKHLAVMNHFRLVFTHLTPDMRTELERSGLTIDEQVYIFSDLDHGLEWCEEQLLEKSQITKTHIATHLQIQLSDRGFSAENTDKLRPYLEQIMLMEGEHLIDQGEQVSDLFFIEIGQVSVYLEMGDHQRVRVQTRGMGTIVGEIGFFLGVPRSASVVADMNTIAYRLTPKALAEMNTKDPELALAFDRLMLKVMAERMVTMNRELIALNR